MLITTKVQKSDKDDYIGSLLSNRIGNIMFQIAAGYSLALQFDKEFIAIPDCNIVKDYIEPLKSTILRNINIIDYIPDNSSLYKDTPGFEYKPFITYKNMLINGLFQSEKYFIHNKQDIINLFSPTDEIITEIKDLYGDTSHCISLNIRRGDYLERPSEFNVISPTWIFNVLRLFDLPKVLVTSDDIIWCKQVLQNNDLSKFTFVDKPSTNKIVVDLYIQSLCKHNIISCSTFSWWGAYLNSNPNKQVISPTPWFGERLSHLDTKDLLPYNWIKIPKDIIV